MDQTEADFPQWIVIDSKVFDLSKFADLHPGGANVLYADGVGK
jgi:prepilin-type processing-associated H-X9-DG protein